MQYFAKTSKKVTFITIILTLLFLLVAPVFSSAFSYVNAEDILTTDGTQDVAVKAKGACVMDQKTGTVLYGKNATQKFYPASTMKIMTALVAIENCDDLSGYLTVSENAVYGIDKSSSHIALDVGEKITREDALYGLLLASGNDCAVALAEDIAGSTEKFVELMNEKAEELDLVNTHFSNPHGLQAKDNYTCPQDLAKIMRSCTQNETFLKIDSTITYTIPKTNKAAARELWNAHKMIKTAYNAYPGVLGGKTGYTDEAHFTLVSYAEKNDMNLIAVTMSSDSVTDECEDQKKLFDFYFKKHETVKLDIPDVPTKVSFAGKKRPVYTDETDAILPKGVDQDKVEYEISYLEDVKAPVSKGEKVGSITAVYDGQKVGEYEIKSSKDVSKFGAFMAVAGKIILVILIIAAVIFALYFVYRKQPPFRRKMCSIVRGSNCNRKD